MASNPKAQCRLDPIQHAYLDDLEKLGVYGKGKSGVMRRLIDAGIQAALERGVIQKRSIEDFGETVGEVGDDDD